MRARAEFVGLCIGHESALIAKGDEVHQLACLEDWNLLKPLDDNSSLWVFVDLESLALLAHLCSVVVEGLAVLSLTHFLTFLAL